MDELISGGHSAPGSADLDLNNHKIELADDALVIDSQPSTPEYTDSTMNSKSEDSYSEEATVVAQVNSPGLKNYNEEKFLHFHENHFSCDHGENMEMEISNDSPLNTAEPSVIEGNDKSSLSSCTAVESGSCGGPSRHISDAMETEDTLSPEENQDLQINHSQNEDSLGSCSRSRIPGRAVSVTTSKPNVQPISIHESKIYMVKRYHAVMQSQINEVRKQKQNGLCDQKLLSATHFYAQEQVVKESLKQCENSCCNNLKDRVKEITDPELRQYEVENSKKIENYNSIVEVIGHRMETIFITVESGLFSQIAISPTNFSVEKIFPDMKNLVDEITKNLSRQWQKHFRDDVLMVMKDGYVSQIKRMQGVVLMYRREVIARLNLSICFPTKAFSELQEQLLNHAEKVNNFKVPQRQHLCDIYKKSVGMINTKLSRYNEALYQSEQLAAKEVGSTAFLKYRHLMEKKISGTLMTDQCVENLHRIYVDIVVEAFKDIANSRFKVTQPWETQQCELRKMLEAQLIIFKRENRENLQKISKLRKKLLQDCEIGHHEAFNAIQKPWKVPQEKLYHTHKESLTRALNILKEITNQFNPELVRVWKDDLTLRLERIQQKYLEKNSVEASPASSPLPLTSVKLQEISGETSYGISIYFGLEEIRVGVYSSLPNCKFSPPEFRFLPFIAFTNKGTIMVGEDAKYIKNSFHIVNLLEDMIQNNRNVEKSFNYNGDYYSLKIEGIFAVYFHGLRLQMESKLQRKIQSCVVAINGLLTSRVKQLLKASLGLAGFKKKLLIPKSTAIGLSYVIQRNSEGERKSLNSTILIAYLSGDYLEAATASASPTDLQMQRIRGLLGYEKSSVKKLSVFASKTRALFWNEDELERKVKHVLKEVIDKMVIHSAVIVCDSVSGCNEKINWAVRKKLEEFKITAVKMNEHSDIILQCAALDASRNSQDKGTAFPTYTNVAPYNMSVDVNGSGPNKIIWQNLEFMEDFRVAFRMDCKRLGTCRLTETYVLHNKEYIVDACTFRYVDGFSELSLTIELNSEGCCTIYGKNSETCKRVKLFTNSKFMILEELKSSQTVIQNILTGEERKYHQAVVVSVQPTISQPESEINNEIEGVGCSYKSAVSAVPVLTDTAAEIKGKLAELVENVRLKIKCDNGATNPMIIEKISSTLSQCEELMGKPDVKIKQLELKFKILETFSTKIVSSK